MDFSFTEEQLAIKQMARDFAEREVAPYVAQWDREETYPAHQILGKAGQLGMPGGVIPEEYGGSAMDFMSLTLMVEEVARVCPTTASRIGQPSCSGGQGILTYGTEEQKMKYLTPTARGEKFISQAVTEPHSGTDIVRRMETTCLRDGDNYVIQGTKAFISSLPWADYFITFATIDKTLAHKGICAFIIEKEWPGVSWQKLHNMVGFRFGGTGELVLDGVRVPAQNRVGEEGEGFKVLMRGTEIGRLNAAARGCGQIQACLEQSVKYAQERIVFGQPIGRYQLIQSKICDMVVGLEASRLVTYHLAWLLDQRVPRVQKEAAIAKMYASDVLMKAATDAVQIHGAYGVSDEYPVGRYFRDAKFLQIVDGSNEIQRVMIAEHTLGYRGG